MAITFAVALLLTAWLTSDKAPLTILDAPNDRSLHQRPTARTGGLAIVCAIASGWSFLAWWQAWPGVMTWIACAALLVAVISFLDDIYALSPLIRVLIHAVAACTLMVDGLVMFDGWSGMLVTWLAIVWMLNLYNFMDGMDGFAGGMTLFGFGFLSVAGWMHGASDYALYAASVAAAAAGFLCMNFPPAKIFMGDAGSATLGLLAAAFSLWGIHDDLFPIWFPILIFSPFIVDATVTLLRRIRRKEKPWQAHRTHYYQRLAQTNWSHKKIVVLEYALMLGVGMSAIMLLLSPEWRITGLIAWCAVYILLAYAVDGYCGKQEATI